MKKEKAQEDLDFIRKVMEDSRRTVADNGMHYINWSVMPALGIIGTYLITQLQLPGNYILWTWVIAIGLGWIFSMVIGRKEYSNRTMSFADKLLSAVWITSGIAMTMIAFAGILSGTIQPVAIPAFIATVIGIPYFIAGLIYNLNWFKLIAVGWWAAGLLFFFWQSYHTLAVLGVLIILFQALPGIFIYKKFSKEQNPVLNG